MTESVHFTIIDEADGYFGEVSDAACSAIVKTSAKSARSFERQDVGEDTLFGLEVSADEFVAALPAQCMGVAP